MIKVFCPGHVSCVFQPIISDNILKSGSRGIGIRLNLGSYAEVIPRNDKNIYVNINGVPSEAPVTIKAVSIIAPNMGFSIQIHNDLPISQGFGMSASGSIAASLCISNILGKSDESAFYAAHKAEILEGGGLGDVSAIVSGFHVPIRETPGIRPFGSVRDTNIIIKHLTLAVVGEKLVTNSIILDPTISKKIAYAGDLSMRIFNEDPTLDKLFFVSNIFSRESGLENESVKVAMNMISSAGYRSGMCMLGNSIFTDAPAIETKNILKDLNAHVFSCSSMSDGISITQIM